MKALASEPQFGREPATSSPRSTLTVSRIQTTPDLSIRPNAGVRGPVGPFWLDVLVPKATSTTDPIF